MKLTQIDEKHNTHYRQIAEVNRHILGELQSYNFDLEDNEITDAIKNRMWAYYNTHDELKVLLGKSQKQAAADYFVECCLFFLKAYFERNHLDCVVRSETIIWNEGRHNIRPDITIWRKEELIATIEVKVQLGRKRLEWKEELQHRESLIKSKIPNSFFAVVCFTENNWQGFDRDENFGTKYFSLTDRDWNPTTATFEKMISAILNAIK